MTDAPVPPLPPDEPRRLAALQALGLLDTPPEAAFDDFAVLAGRACGTPVALVSLVDADRQWFKARIGFAPAQTPRAEAFCAHAILGDALFEVPDADADPRFAGGAVRDAGLRFYAGVPIATRDGARVGTLCVLDHRPRALDAEQRDTLRRLARQLEHLIALRELDRAQRETEARLQAQAQELKRVALVAERTHHAVLLLDRDGRIRWINGGFTRLTGWTAAEALTRRPGTLLDHEHTDAAARRTLDAAVAAFEPAQVRLLNRRRDGSPYWADVELQPLLDDEGRPDGFLSMQTDVTDLVHQREQAQALLQALPVGVMLQDRRGRVLEVNDAAVQIAGLARGTLLGRQVRTVTWDPVDRAGRPLTDADDPVRRAIASGRPAAFGPIGVLAPDGSRRWLSVSSVPLLGPNGRVDRVVSSLSDDTEERLQRQLLTLAVDAARITPWYWDLAADRVEFRRDTARAAGLRFQTSEAPLQQVAFWPSVHRDDAPRVRESLAAHDADPSVPYRCEFRLRDTDGAWRWVLAAGAASERDAEGRTRFMAGIVIDITERRLVEDALRRAATTDALTGLPNRAMLQDRLRQALNGARRRGRHGALLYLDLDHFKRVNDVYGHGVGDRVLVAAGRRLSAALRTEDTLARMGGDELMVLLPDLGDDAASAADGAQGVGRKLLEALAQPFEIDGLDFGVGASIGVTLFPKHEAETADDLVREADTAMYAAKSAGRAGLRLYEATMQAAVARRFALEHALGQAVERGELRLALQGKFHPDGRIAGAEALLRWQHPERGLVPPAEFIPIAEDSGQIVAIGRWVLREALALLAERRRNGRPLALAVNVSPRQFRDPGFADDLLALARESGAEPSDLTLELTEGVLLDDVDACARRMNRLAAHGFHFSIDDFGTGYSSLLYLKKLPIHELKIDRAFVRDVAHDPEDAAIVQVIVSIGRRFGITLVAEGVETAEQLAFLEAQGCTLMQGWYFGRAEPQEAFLAALDAAA